jgi:acetyl-CoA carboxylase biotin carboxyl carrier protein
VDAADQDRFQQYVKEAKDLVKMLEATSVRRMSLHVAGFRIDIERAFAESGAAPAMTAMAVGAVAPAGGVAAPVKDTLHRVVAPLVGTFYRSSSPGSKAFVEVGTRVQRGQVIGIVEAMKIMNEVNSDAAGVVTEILVENGQPVQYGEALLVIDTAA